ncbi:MAG TPA: protein kinase [Candidatus Eisenbacteria bacterium]|nr:protein kinase [Candidatus Eisenbacteria bacterium]
MSLKTGTRLGAYEILAPLGAGGMGEVYRARDHRLGRDVAVKVLPEAVAASAERLARLEREAKTVASLNHPNIVTLHSIEESDGVRFLTMELVEGESLDLLVARGGLPVPRLLELAIPIADALAAAHEKGIVHRDLKPANVMVSKDGRVKVLDFGLAKPAAAGEQDATADAATLTVKGFQSVEGHVMGTIPYMAPEQLRGEPLDARTDLFPLGVILYELTTGRRPFDGRTEADLASSILRDIPPPMAAERDDLPADLVRIVGRCLEKNPENRFQTAKDVRNELRLVEAAVASGGGALAYARPSTARLSTPGRRAPRWLAPALVIVAVAVAIGGYRVWESSRAGKPTPPESPASATAPAEYASVAVLPFVDLSPAKDQEYFADGISEELLNVLAQLKGVRVAARTSSFSFKGKEVQIPEVGRQLHVAHVLEGSVRKEGKRYRITAQLIQASDGFHVWSETFDLVIDDVFSVQDRIAQAVVKELRTALEGTKGAGAAAGLNPADVQAAASGRGTNPEAYRLYLQGRFFYDRFNEGDMAKAIDFFRRAVALDPENALAWAGLSRAHMAQASWGWATSADEGFARAREAAERSLKLEPDLAEGYVALGWVNLWHDWNWSLADSSYQRALALAPGNADVLHAVSGAFASLGRLDQAIDLDRRAAALDPLSVSALRNLGAHAYQAGRLAEADSALKKAMELGPENGFLPYGTGLVRIAQGRAAEARALFERVPVDYFRLHGLVLSRFLERDRAGSDAALRELIEKHRENALFQIAGAYAFRGETDRAFEWLEKAYARRDPGLAEVKIDPLFRSLRGDPRWGVFLKKMGFTG